jgi:uncharacterized membrane protein
MDTQGILLGSAIMMALVLVPGYALTRGLFSRKELSVAWIMVLSFFLGLVPPLILYALNKNISTPINSQTTLLTAAFVTAVGAVLWWGRQGK